MSKKRLLTRCGALVKQAGRGRRDDPHGRLHHLVGHDLRRSRAKGDWSRRGLGRLSHTLFRGTSATECWAKGVIAMPDFTARRLMMVDTQVRPSDVTKFPIIDAMLRVPRELYVPSGKEEAAYMGENLPLGGQRVLLEARTLAKMLDALMLRREDLVLDLGCAFGYSSAVIASMVEAVVAIEEDPDMVREAERTLAAEGVDNVAVIEAPLAQGAAKHGPYDVIIIQGAVEQIGDAILAQLKDGGRIAAIFAEGALGVVRIGYKSDVSVTWRFDFNAGAPVLPGFEKNVDFAL